MRELRNDQLRALRTALEGWAVTTNSDSELTQSSAADLAAWLVPLIEEWLIEAYRTGYWDGS